MLYYIPSWDGLSCCLRADDSNVIPLPNLPRCSSSEGSEAGLNIDWLEVCVVDVSLGKGIGLGASDWTKLEALGAADCMLYC